MSTHDKREVSLSRAEELKSSITEYLSARETIKKGRELTEILQKRKQKILLVLGGTEEDWKDWKWQMNRRIKDVDTLSKIIRMDERKIEQIREVEGIYRWSITPYYVSLIDEEDPACPILRMFIPSIEEITDNTGTLDPMHEEYTNPAGSITRRYPDRLILKVTNECGGYCRFCQRRRNIGSICGMIPKNKIQESIDYIRACTEIRDVLVTGGDPLTISDDKLDWILGELRSIPHVEIIRIGSRTPVTMPQRITNNLCKILKKYHPLFINTHFNHPVELTQESIEAVEKLVNAGIVMGNQMVLLNGVNNDKHVVKVLNHELLRARIRPYYIFHAKSVKGTAHFKCKIDEGLEIMEHLRGYTSGLAIPTYIVNAPGGLGKIPILPDYLISKEEEQLELRTWEGKKILYKS